VAEICDGVTATQEVDFGLWRKLPDAAFDGSRNIAATRIVVAEVVETGRLGR